MKPKKWFLLLNIIVILTMITACQPQVVASPEATVEAPTAAVETPVEVTASVEKETAPEPEQITLGYTRYAGSIPYDLELVDKFMEENPNIKVEVNEVPSEESFNKLLLQQQGGQMPDVFWSHWVLAAATSEMAIPVDDFIKESGGQTFRDRFVSSAWDFVSWDGKAYGIQWRDGASVAYLNKKLLDKAGLEVPTEWTWDDLVKYAQAMTDADAGVYGIGVAGSATAAATEWDFWPFLLQAGGKILDEDNKAVFNSPEGVEALTFMVDLVNKHKVAPPGTASNDIDQIIDLFVADKIGIWFDGPWYIGIMRGTYPDAEVVVAPMPSHKTQGSIAGGTAMCISAQSKHPKEAWKLLEYLTSDEHLTEWARQFQHVPPNVAAFKEDFLKNDSNFAAAIGQSQHPDTVSANHYPETDQLNQIMRTHLQAAYLGEMTPQEALDAAVTEWNKILAQY
jgi:ABC-type glycerol-3-phosphate transport system substrate-binding protein